jgi:anti-sigma-K factor RskA
LAQAKESDRALAGAVAERGTLQGELDRALEQVKLADAARASSEAEARLATQAEERIAELTRQLGKANATIADLRGAAARDGEILAFLRGGPTRQIDLRRIDVAAGEAAAVAYIASGRGLLLVAHGLPQLPAGKCYQLWATHKSGTAVESVGLLKTDGAGTGYLYARASTDLEHVTGLAITDEPSGGSVSARGRKLLFGVLN